MRIRLALAHVLRRILLAGLALWTGSSGPAAAGDRAFVTLNARVLSRTSIDMQRVPEHLVISPQDAARGYVDVDEPVELLIRSNHPGAVFLGFTRLGGYVQAIDVGASEGGSPLSMESGAVVLPQLGRGMRSRTVSLRLRFMLAPGTTAGTIPFPLVLFVAPG